MSNLLVIIAGPTATGKTALALSLAQKLRTHVLSCDSRQFYREMRIGTAAPSATELALVPHHFIGNLSITDCYNAARYESEALTLLESLFLTHRIVIACGGSGLYINSLCHGIDELPDPDPELRLTLKETFQTQGLSFLHSQLLVLDPNYFQRVDKQNPHRMLRALEVCITTGKPYSSLLHHQPKMRPFKVLKIGLTRDRTELFERISMRTDLMIEQGLIEEVQGLLPYRHLNALNTVGYKEFFEYFDGLIPLDQAITNIKTNTRRYAKRQLTWFKKDPEYQWFYPSDEQEIYELIMKSA